MKNDLIKNHKVRSRFIKDYSMPFNLVHDPYFDYFLKLFDEDYNTIKDYNYLENLLELCHDVQHFFTIVESVKNVFISKVVNTSSYDNFCLFDISKYDIDKPIHTGKYLYSPENHNKTFMSIDMVEANFNSMNLFSKDIFKNLGNPSSFKMALEYITHHSYLLNSKKLRQIIFGNLNPKRQSKIQKYVIYEIVKRLCDEYNIIDRMVEIHDDEIVLEYDDSLSEIMKDIQIWSKVPLHFNIFKLEQIGNTQYYIKYKNDGKIEIKGVPSYLMPQVYKVVKGLPIEEMDRTFYFEKQIAIFKDSFEKRTIK